MKVIETSIDGAYIFYPDIYKDDRGYFVETFNQNEFDKYVPNVTFVQDNQSHSVKNVLRGLHFQKAPYEQAKLVRCSEGYVIDVAIDLRKDSPTYLNWVKVDLYSDKCNYFYIPKGCAHGFVVVSDEATFQYKCDEFYHPEAEDGINAFDPYFDIDWEVNKEDAIMTDKDRNRKNYEIDL